MSIHAALEKAVIDPRPLSDNHIPLRIDGGLAHQHLCQGHDFIGGRFRGAIASESVRVYFDDPDSSDACDVP